MMPEEEEGNLSGPNERMASVDLNEIVRIGPDGDGSGKATADVKISEKNDPMTKSSDQLRVEFRDSSGATTSGLGATATTTASRRDAIPDGTSRNPGSSIVVNRLNSFFLLVVVPLLLLVCK